MISASETSPIYPDLRDKVVLVTGARICRNRATHLRNLPRLDRHGPGPELDEVAPRVRVVRSRTILAVDGGYMA